VKIGLKLQSLGKISNISAADPPPQFFRPIPTLIKGALAFVCFSFFFLYFSCLHVLD